MLFRIKNFFLFFLFFSELSFAGELFVTPISQYTFTSDRAKINLLNGSQEKGYLHYSMGCLVNNVKLLEEDCKKYFEFDLKDLYENEGKSVLVIPQNSQIEKEVILKYKPTAQEPFYAIFNPIFTVVDQTTQKSDSVTFNIRFSPGILFVKNPQKENLELTSFKTRIDVKKIRSVNFEFDLTKLKYPQVVSMNAKILDKKTKKLIRFLNLSKDRILDPSRKIFSVSENIDMEKEDENSLCYEIYVMEILTNSMHKLQNKC